MANPGHQITPHAENGPRGPDLPPLGGVILDRHVDDINELLRADHDVARGHSATRVEARAKATCSVANFENIDCNRAPRLRKFPREGGGEGAAVGNGCGGSGSPILHAVGKTVGRTLCEGAGPRLRGWEPGDGDGAAEEGDGEGSKLHLVRCLVSDVCDCMGKCWVLEDALIRDGPLEEGTTRGVVRFYVVPLIRSQPSNSLA